MSAQTIASSRQSSGEIAILEAAIHLFSTHGFDGVSMRQIAESAGVSKANIYHHFKSKEALYLAIISDSAKNLSRLIENLADGDGEMSDALESFAAAHLDHLFENQTTVRLVLREGWSGGDQGSQLITAQVMNDVFEKMKAIFKSGQQCGVLRDDLDPGLCALMLLGTDLMFFQFQDVLKHMPGAAFARDRANYTREMTDVLLNGMRAQSGSAGARS